MSANPINPTNPVPNSSLKPKTAARGRRPGAVSFMQVTLEELNRVLKPDAKVILSLKYGTLVGLNGKAVGGDMTVMEHCVNSGRIDMSVETFEDCAGAEEDDRIIEPKDLLEDNRKGKAGGKGENSDGEDGFVIPVQADLHSWDD
jgi:hypothetical protein